MKKFIKVSSFTIGLISLLSLAAFAREGQPRAFDVTNYRMDVQLSPDEQKLGATVDVDFSPLEDSRTVAFELNGSLKIERSRASPVDAGHDDRHADQKQNVGRQPTTAQPIRSPLSRTRSASPISARASGSIWATPSRKERP